MVGPGISQFKFRLLEGTRDSNYAKWDSGERHVFEILRIDTTVVHVHYHKNGHPDEPVTLPSAALLENANSGASQPTVPFVAMAEDPSGSQPLIGRREAVTALDSCLNACWKKRAGAVDITDAVGFNWIRFFSHTRESLEIQELDIAKVFALRTTESGNSRIAICTTGTGWKIFDPIEVHYKNSTQRFAARVMHWNWRSDPLLMQAQKVPTSWMRLK
jgi:hypothetical protein